MGRISKQILDDINGKSNRKLNVTLWKNSAAVIEWFQSIEMKESCTFTSFNIIEFSPSISEDLLNRAIRFANNHIDTGDDEVATIHILGSSCCSLKIRHGCRRKTQGYSM